jgi:hypothetical protein
VRERRNGEASAGRERTLGTRGKKSRGWRRVEKFEVMKIIIRIMTFRKQQTLG